MRKLKVPGRIIGREILSPYRRYFYPYSGRRSGTVYRFQDDTDLPIVLSDMQGNPQDPLVVMANGVRTFWESPWGEDERLVTRHGEDIDRDGRDRMGMLVKSPRPDEAFIRRVTVEALLGYSVGILADGSVCPAGRCWAWGRGFRGEN